MLSSITRVLGSPVVFMPRILSPGCKLCLFISSSTSVFCIKEDKKWDRIFHKPVQVSVSWQRAFSMERARNMGRSVSRSLSLQSCLSMKVEAGSLGSASLLLFSVGPNLHSEPRPAVWPFSSCCFLLSSYGYSCPRKFQAYQSITVVH